MSIELSDERVLALVDSLKTALNEMLPDSIPEDLLPDLKAKNNALASKMGEAILDFCNALVPKVEITYEDISKPLGTNHSLQSGRRMNVMDTNNTERIGKTEKIKKMDLITILGSNSSGDIQTSTAFIDGTIG